MTLRIAGLRVALASGDGEQLRQMAHALSGSAAQIGATRLSALCTELETAGARAALEVAPALVDAVASEAAAIDTWLVGHGFPH